MKWETKETQEYAEPRIWNIRRRSRFLIFPKCINKVYRWLEHAEWEEERERKTADGFMHDWKAVKWTDI